MHLLLYPTRKQLHQVICYDTASILFGFPVLSKARLIRSRCTDNINCILSMHAQISSQGVHNAVEYPTYCFSAAATILPTTCPFLDHVQEYHGSSCMQSCMPPANSSCASTQEQCTHCRAQSDTLCLFGATELQCNKLPQHCQAPLVLTDLAVKLFVIYHCSLCRTMSLSH